MPPRQHRSFHCRKQLAAIERLEDRRLLAAASQAEYMPLYLASDQANQALLQDPNLVNPWGIAQRISNHQGVTSGPTEGSFSIADHGTGAISQFGGNVNGSPLAPAATISVPGGSPMGVVGIPVLGNGSNQNYGFTLGNGSSSAPADFLFAGGGRISGWNPNVSVNSAELAAIAANSNFTGLAFGSVAQIGPVIYAADFQNNRIVVFNSSFQLVPQDGTFIDPDLPAGEAPYNIMNLNGTLFVAYARQAPGGQAPVTGQGYGVIDAFSEDGAFMGRVTTSGPGVAGSHLDAPWGMAIAPSSFSQYGGDLLVANTGNGQINAFNLQNLNANPSTLPDNYVGTLLDPSGRVLTIDGLRGLGVGNDATAGSSSTVYFTAGPNNATHGLFGSITSIDNNSGTIGVPLVAAGGEFLAGFNTPFSGTVATFSDVYGHDTGVNPFTTLINWGDGTSSVGSVRQVGPNQYLVQGTHTYTVTGAYNVTVAIADAHSNTAAVSSIAAVVPTSGGGLEATGVSLSAQPGANFNGVVANFTDAGGSAVPSAYTADINWGDGAASTGTISAKGNGFQVSGQHVYANAGSNTVTIVIHDSNGNSVTTTATATIANGALNATAAAVAATEGVAFSGAVAAFTDSDKSLSADDFSAAIAWGDGATTAGTVSGFDGQFSVSGSHVYTDVGIYTAHVAIVQTAGGSASAAVAVPVHVVDAPLTFSGVPFTAKVGSTFSGAVATFADANPLAKSSDFTAAIQWGDGAATAGTVTGTGPFTVTGMHAYTANGDYTVTTSIRDVGGSTVSGTTSAIVSQYPLIGSPVSISGTEGLTFSGNVATFTDTNPNGGTLSNYTASIDWGDGATTGGSISGSAGNYTVSGTHVFTDVVSTVTVVIDENGSPAATIESPATIADANVLSGAANSVSAIAGVPLLAPLATFHDVYTASPASNFDATIAWGDGAMTAGTVSGQNGVFTVRGNHVYTQAGTQTAVVTLRDKPPGTASASVSVPVTITDAPLVANNYTFYPTPNSTYHGVVATFNDVNQAAPATDFTATIAWDDGTIDTGNVVAAGGGLFDVIDTHSFGPAGSTAQATVTVNSVGGGGVTMQSTAIVTAGGSATTPDERWVNALFQDLLGRPAGSAALTYFGEMAATNRGQVVSDILHSDEYLSDQVRALYEHYLHRPADAGGLSYFVGQLQNGMGVRQVALVLASSPEFFATQGGDTTDGFLNALFEDILDRPIGADAEQFFGQQLAAGTSRETIVADILSSPEHLADIINAEYEQLLSRPADPVAMNYWTAYLQSGLHRDDIVMAIGESTEFYDRAS